MRRKRIFLALGCSLIVVAFWGVPARGQSTSAPTPATIEFTSPAAFRCDARIKWTDLRGWNGEPDTSICASEPFYTVKGKVKGAPQGAQLKAEICVPEAKQCWPTSGGGILPVRTSDSGFTGNFCIPQKGPARKFKFTLYTKDLDRLKECVVTVVGI